MDHMGNNEDWTAGSDEFKVRTREVNLVVGELVLMCEEVPERDFGLRAPRCK